MRPRVVLLSRESNPPYRFLEVEIEKGKPVAPEDSTSFYLRYSVNGKRKVEPVGQDITAAFAAYQNRELNHARISQGLKPIEAEASALIEDFKTAGAGSTIAEAATAYLAKQTARVNDWRAGSKGGLSPGTLGVIRKAMEDFQSACEDFGAARVNEFKNPERGKAILLHFKKWLNENTKRRNGMPASTDEKKFTYVGEFLAINGVKMAKDKKVRYDGDPGLLDWHEVPQSERRSVSSVVYYTPADLLAMWRAAKEVNAGTSFTTEDLRDLLMVLTLTGMRDEEVQHMEWQDVNWDDGIKVGNKIKEWDWRPKNGERTAEPIEYFADALRSRLRARSERMKTDKGLVFPNRERNPDQNFADRINYMQDLAEAGRGQPDGKRFNFSRREARDHVVHNFRRTFATVLNSCYGLSAPTVQDRIGDRDMKTTSRYLGKVKEPLRMKKEFESLPFDDKPKKESR
jgi:integrase